MLKKMKKETKFSKIVAKEEKSEWRQLSYWIDNRKIVTVIHPITQAFVILQDFDLEIKLIGTDLYCLCPVQGEDDDTTGTEKSPLPDRKGARQEQHNET